MDKRICKKKKSCHPDTRFPYLSLTDNQGARGSFWEESGIIHRLRGATEASGPVRETSESSLLLPVCWELTYSKNWGTRLFLTHI